MYVTCNIMIKIISIGIHAVRIVFMHKITWTLVYIQFSLKRLSKMFKFCLNIDRNIFDRKCKRGMKLHEDSFVRSEQHIFSNKTITICGSNL